MKVQDVKVLRGPNFWSVKRHNLIQATIDLEELEYRPTNELPGFFHRLQLLLPSLYDHECSRGRPGGFFERVQEGTWMGHVIEHIAIAIQNLAGIEVSFGRARGTGKEGIYHVVFEYGCEKQGRYALDASMRIAGALVEGRDYDVDNDIRKIGELWVAERLGPSTAAIVEEAAKRNIPHVRLDDESLVQLGYGCRLKLIEGAITSNTRLLSADIAGDKQRTRQLLLQANIPVPRGAMITTEEELLKAAGQIGFPLVIKPLDGNHGKGVSIRIPEAEALIRAFHLARNFSSRVIVEEFIPGNDYRVLVVNNRFIAAGWRRPASVRGNGSSTIYELISEVNKDPRRAHGHDGLLTRIEADAEMEYYLASRNLTLDSVIPPGEECQLKQTANLSTGGTSVDITDEVHPENRKLCERVARITGLDICGIDIMASDMREPLRLNGGAVIEVNAAPGLRMHLSPDRGMPRNVARPIVDMLFHDNGRIPLVAVTGTNGKTTTARLIAHMAAQAGFLVGATTTDGVYIDGDLVEAGDCSGPGSAQVVLRDPSVQFAVMETARGGLLRSGLGFDQCSTAVITNVEEDHLGLEGIHTLEQLAKVKSIIAESVCENGYAVLNADDDLVYGMKDRLSCHVALFSMFSESSRIEEHCSRGGLAAVYENGYLLLRVGNHIIPIEEVAQVPVTFGGKASFNIANVLASCLAAYTQKIRLSTIRQALRSFMPSLETTPGRLNFFEFSEFTVMLDYAHNQHGMRALGQFICSIAASRKVGVITAVGDRRDEDIIAIAEEAARIFDEIIIRHDDDLRGRTHEEMDHLLTTGIRRQDPEKPVKYYWSEKESAEKTIMEARPGSLVVILSDNYKSVTAIIQRLQQAENQGRSENLKQAV